MFLKILKILQENTCVGVYFCPQACNFIKMRLQHSCRPVKFAKFLRTPFSYRTPPVAASNWCHLWLMYLIGAFNISGATWTFTTEISEVGTMAWHPVYLHKHNLAEVYPWLQQTCD